MFWVNGITSYIAGDFISDLQSIRIVGQVWKHQWTCFGPKGEIHESSHYVCPWFRICPQAVSEEQEWTIDCQKLASNLWKNCLGKTVVQKDWSSNESFQKETRYSQGTVVLTSCNAQKLTAWVRLFVINYAFVLSLYVLPWWFQTEEAKKVIRNYNKMAAVLMEFEV